MSTSQTAYMPTESDKQRLIYETSVEDKESPTRGEHRKCRCAKSLTPHEDTTKITSSFFFLVGSSSQKNFLLGSNAP
jgi:hypothetical protein